MFILALRQVSERLLYWISLYPFAVCCSLEEVGKKHLKQKREFSLIKVICSVFVGGDFEL